VSLLAAIVAIGLAGGDGMQARIPRRKPEPEQCDPRPASPDLPLFVLGHEDNATLSSAWVGEPQETGVADIEIEPGDPIHLLIGGRQRTIYRFAGAVDRIRRLTLVNGEAAGASGIAPDRIDYGRTCFRGQSLDEPTEAVRDAVRARLGRAPDVVGGIYELWRARIGSAIDAPRVPPIDMRADPETNNLYTYHRGGLAWVDAAQVASNVAVGRYPVLPLEAGVRQLVASGALVRATEADARRWNERARRRGVPNPHAVHGAAYGIYRVARPTPVPAGLCGGHSIRLYARAPEDLQGDLCHVTVYFDDGTAIGPDAPR
jgi:hypothetical protein